MLDLNREGEERTRDGDTDRMRSTQKEGFMSFIVPESRRDETTKTALKEKNEWWAEK